MRILLLIVLVVPLFFFISHQGLSQTSLKVDLELERLQKEWARRQEVMNNNFVMDASLRAATETATGVSFLTETVIFKKAAELKLTATDKEIQTFLLPMLVQQGLVDYSCNNIFTDPNILTWINGQKGMKLEDLRNSGKALVLWSKISTQGISVTEEEVLAFVKSKPQMASIPAKVRITLTRYIAPEDMNARGLLPTEVLIPSLHISSRNIEDEVKKPNPEIYKNLMLWLELDKVDEVLRHSLTGQKIDYKFGPLLLANGATVEGYIKDFSPSVDFLTLPAFWQMASIRTRLAKANQYELFESLVEEFINEIPTPAIRGFWSTVWGGAKKSFSYITGGIGGIAGFVATGNPKIALMGAKYGYQLGNAVKGYFGSSNQSSINFPKFPSIPQNYLNGNSFQIPNSYHPVTNPYQPNQYIIPSPPLNYQPAFYRPGPFNSYSTPQMQQQWAPQLFFPQPVGYFY